MQCSPQLLCSTALPIPNIFDVTVILLYDRHLDYQEDPPPPQRQTRMLKGTGIWGWACGRPRSSTADSTSCSISCSSSYRWIFGCICNWCNY